MKRILAVLAGGWMLALGACNETPVTEHNVPPSVQIVEPDDADRIPEFILGEAVLFSATANDSHDASEALVAAWSTTWLDSDGAQLDADLGGTVIDDSGHTTLLTDALEVGAHRVEIKVTDLDGGEAFDHVDVRVVEQNDPPSVQITAPADGESFDEHDTVNFAAIATDDHDVTALVVRWLSDLHAAPLDGTGPSDNGAIQFQTDGLVPGEHTITVEVDDDAGQGASDSVVITVIAENLAPSMPTVTIEPLGPDTTDDLACQASGSVDPEGELVSYEYAWEVGGVAFPWTGQVIGAADTETGDQWTCYATPSDPQGLEGIRGYATVIVGNTLPSFTGVVLTPTPAYEDSLLACTPSGWYDPDGDPEGALYAWWVAGAQTAASGDTLDGSWFDHFDDVHCVVTPFDGVDQGLPLTSNTVTIENTLPADPVLELSPDPLHYDEDLECLVVTPDPDVDGDALSYEVRWYRDGALEAGLVDPLVSAAATMLGEEWTCEVRAHDGTGWSGWTSATTMVMPHEGDLVITELMIDPRAVDDGAGEYIELFNTSLETLPLDGFQIGDGAAQQHVIQSGNSAAISPGDYFVLGLNAAIANNGGVPVDYQYSTVTLAEAIDTVRISFEGLVVDQVTYDWGGGFPAPSGRAMSLDPALLTAADNDLGAAWCASTTPIVEWGDHGTPGADNESCDCDYSDADGDGFGIDGSCPVDYLDCDDADPGVHPGAYDICEDGVDQDCLDGDRPCTCAESDLDGDGYGTTPDCAAIDCDDNDPAIHPGANEICDGIDNDCDGTPDDGLTFAYWYEDADGDGHGDAATEQHICDGPPGPDWVQNDDDCDDGDPARYLGNNEVCDGIDNDCDGAVDDGLTFASWYQDLDGDGHGDPATEQFICDGPPGAGWVQLGDDCDDGNAARHGGATELCDGIDNDCNGTADDGLSFIHWYLDYDGDGYGDAGNHQYICDGPPSADWVQNDDDCNDYDADNYPGNAEVCDNADNNCDGNADEGQNNLYCTTYHRDSDGDGYGDPNYHQCLCDPDYFNNYDVTNDDDCYDNESDARPGTTAWHDTHRGDGSYDYNCDTSQEKRWTTSSSCSVTLPEFCDGPDGWSGSSPACGSSGTWRSGCHFSFDGWPWEWGCAYSSSVSRTQECR